MFVLGMPVVVNQNIFQGLKLVNGARYEALDVILDKAYPGYRINASTILHFGPPAGILLVAESTRDYHFVGMSPKEVGYRDICFCCTPVALKLIVKIPSR